MAGITTDFKAVGRFGDNEFMNQLEVNLKTWFDWAFLRIGAWTDVAIPSSTIHQGDMSVLRAVVDRSYTNGQVWESARKDWAWEADVQFVGPDSFTADPRSPVAVTVDGIPVDASQYHVNYPLGRIVFNTAISQSSVVRAAYSYRSVQTHVANEVDWWQELQYRSFRQDSDYFSQNDNGDWSVGSNHRVQMPCIIIECVPRTNSAPYQLGDGSSWVEQDVLCHVLAENRSDRNNITDILLRQFDKTIWLFNVDDVLVAGDFPLDVRGEIIDSSKTYNELVSETNGYRWKQCRFIRTQSSEIASLNPSLYMGVVRMTCEVILDD